MSSSDTACRCILSLRPALPRNIPHGSEMDGPDVRDLPAVRFRCRPRSNPRSRHVAKALNEAESSISHKTFAVCVQYYRSAVGPLANMQALETDPLQRHSTIPGGCASHFQPKATSESGDNLRRVPHTIQGHQRQ
jgi:hypothetical protein